jgi:hypothetical protein
MLDETFEDDGWIELYTCSCLEGTSCDMPFQLVERRETTLSLASRWEAGTGLQEVTLSAILLYFSTPPRARGPPPTLSWPSPHPYVTAPETRLGPARRRPGPAASAAERIIPITKVVKLTTCGDYNFLQQKMPVIHSLATLHRITALTGCSYNVALYNPSRDH